jgi:hypothetical protein
MIWHYVIASCLGVWFLVVLRLYAARRMDRLRLECFSRSLRAQQVPRRGQTPKPERPVTETRTP